MANSKRRTNKAKEMEQKKLREEAKRASQEKLDKEKAEIQAREEAAKEREEKKNAEQAAKMEKVTRYKCIITTLVALCFAFVAGILYNWYSSGGHLFDGEVVYFNDVEDSWHMFNGRYMRIRVDSAFKWYDGVREDETTGELVMSGKEASCLIWLDSGNFMSITVDNKEDFEKLKSIMSISEEYVELLDASMGNPTYYSNTLEHQVEYFEGQLKRPDSARLKKMKDAYAELMKEWEFEVGDYYIYELTLDTTSGNGAVKVTTIVYAVLAVLFLIASIVAGMKYHNYKKINGIKLVRE